MKLYLDNLIPRLKEFSLNLDKQEIFIDKQWVIIDSESNKQTYIFRRNGELIMSLNGQVTIGKWEYIDAAKSLLIDRIKDKILLNQYFIDSAVMILKKDGFKEANFIMVNENLIPDLNVINYLKQLYYKKNNIEIKKLRNGDSLELKRINSYCYSIGTFVTIDDKPVKDDIYEFEDSNRKYLIEDGFIIKTFFCTFYKTNKGDIIIEQKNHMETSIGDKVFKNNTIASDGKYRLGFLSNIFVLNGQISKKTIV